MNHYLLRIFASICIAILAGALRQAGAQENLDDVSIETVKVADGIYMLIGWGGNIGLCVGEDGAFLVDDQVAPLTKRIRAAIAALTDDDVRFLINTHWHFDHTGGNENMGEAGALIIAHENVRKRMSVDQFMRALDLMVPASPESALPVITFTEAVTFHWNREEIQVFHVEHAHTDGDAIAYFTKANVVHMGDVYFNGRYPFIDVESGGGVNGVIDAVDRVLVMANPSTKIIPGHGLLSTPDELREYRDMLAAVRDRVLAMKKEGKTQEEVVAAKPTSDFDAKWGAEPDLFVRSVYLGVGKE